ncbi:MAG TPA: substrate-binding domain-containing protein [Gemmatimonadaceae bacterium]|nr:substrate-binding domain-containing protein [Gemmatimonadaceae bacterium]
MRSLNVTTVFAASTLVLLACADTQPPAPAIRVDGSPGVLPLVQALAGAYTGSDAATVTLASGLGSSARAAAVEDSTIDIAMASHGIDTADLSRRGLVAHEIARTAVVFAVNAGVNLPGLTRSQVCDIIAGRAANWNRFRAGNVPIVPLMRPATEVDAEVALAHVSCLRGLQHGGRVQLIERPDSMASALAATPGAFGVTSATMVEQSQGRIRALSLDGVTPSRENVQSQAYPLLRSSYLIARADPGAAVARFLEFVRDTAGARIIAANGAVPVTR